MKPPLRSLVTLLTEGTARGRKIVKNVFGWDVRNGWVGHASLGETAKLFLTTIEPVTANLQSRMNNLVNLIFARRVRRKRVKVVFKECNNIFCRLMFPLLT